MRVLLVEDQVKLGAVVRRAFDEEGIAIDVAATGEDALWMASATDYDVIVLDVNAAGHYAKNTSGPP